MWQKQFSAKPEPETPLYVVGDIHGRCDLLIKLIALIDQDAQSRSLSDHAIVFVGDFVDRGPQSSLVLSVMLNLFSDEKRKVIALRGNHEEMLLSFLDDASEGPRWLKHGGYETLTSYGIAHITENSGKDMLALAQSQFTSAIGHETIQFLENLGSSYQSGNIFVSHAGADPSLPVGQQDQKTLVWGTDKFKKKTRKDKIWVAHGHYAEASPSIEGGRISIDTGAYFSNQLTAARILDDEIKFLTAES